MHARLFAVRIGSLEEKYFADPKYFTVSENKYTQSAIIILFSTKIFLIMSNVKLISLKQRRKHYQT